MNNIESIKQKILQLDPGSFQNLCDAYLSKKGYPNIVSLGGQAGTRKTTSGTPDTYFVLPNGKYVFVEYTTQQNSLVKKIKDDINKCLNVSKTKISHDKIEEIIYCHTSSSIKPAEDKGLKDICKKAGINLVLIGIDKLAEDIYLLHPILCRDFLEISIDSNQIMDIDDFVKEYNSNRLAAPIDTEFLFREDEIAKIDAAFIEHNIVILSGAAGSGKTRLALHYADKYKKENKSKLYCIRNKSLSIYEDLKLFLSKPGDYILVIDDANQFREPQHILRYTTMLPKGYNVKIIITVRDYALEKVINDVREIDSYGIIKINPLTNNQIKELLEKVFNILHPEYQDQILNISQGNARIAMLAGRIALNSNNLKSIADASQLYDEYYGKFLNNEILLDSDSLITAGIIAFWGAIYLDHIDIIFSILKDTGISKDNFIRNIKELSDKEVVDIYNDKAIRFSEECFANYILKFVFFDKKLLSLSNTIDICFQYDKERTIYVMNTLLSVFGNKNLVDFVSDEILKLWNKLKAEESAYFYTFVKAFFRVNPTETLIILKNKIEQVEPVNIKISDDDIKKGKNHQIIQDEIIEILGGFSDMQDLISALDLFFKYYSKRPDLFMDFYYASNVYFGIKKDSDQIGYVTQISYLEKIKEYSDDWQDENIIELFLEVAEQLLKLNFTPGEPGPKKTFIIYNISLVLSEEVKQYRKVVWEYLIEIGKKAKYKEKIRKIISKYGDYRDKSSLSVMDFDLMYIKEILQNTFPSVNLKNSILAHKIVSVYKKKKIDSDKLFRKYLDSKSFKLYTLLIGHDFYKYNKEQFDTLKKQNIEDHLQNANDETLKFLIDICTESMNIVEHEYEHLKEGLGIALNAISKNKDLYLKTVAYYLDQDTPLNINPCIVVNNLLLLINEDEVLKLINEYNFNQKNFWIYAYYHELPAEVVSENHLSGLYKFLSNDSDKEISSSPLRNVDFLEKFSFLDQDVFIKGCEIILAKRKYSPYIMNLYFSSLFDTCKDKPQNIVRKFSTRIDLLIEIYIEMLSYNQCFDYDGKILKEIYITDSSILEKYIDILTNDTYIDMHTYEKQMGCFFELDNYIDVYNEIIELYMKKSKSFFGNVQALMKKILLPNQDDKEIKDKQDQWIRQYIQTRSNNDEEMKYLFLAIANLDGNRKKDYIELFLMHNSKFKSFEKIPLTPIPNFCVESLIPIYDEWIQFLEQLLPFFVGITWVEHKKYVENKIYDLRERIEIEQIKEIIENRC